MPQIVPEGIPTMSPEDRAKMFTPEEMRFLVEMAQDVYGGPSDFDREVQKHLNRYEEQKSEKKKKKVD
jgi:hypothetical protein